MRAKHSSHTINHFGDFYAKPWVMIERVRAFYMKKEERKILDKELSEYMGICRSGIGTYKNRGSHTFALYIMKWCILNNQKIEEYVLK